jgi:hypothetical protein
MRGTPYKASLAALVIVSVAGCGSNPTCGDNTDYQQAVDLPRLQLPEGVQATERISPLVIPPLAPDAARPDPEQRCLDEPPPFFARKGAIADPAEEAVMGWARAWSEQKADAVLQLYSPAFQASGGTGSAEFLDQRREQVTTGRPPAPQLEDLKVTTLGADRRVVTFVQRFGDDRIRKELTLVRENTNWRIVSERTLEVL